MCSFVCDMLFALLEVVEREKSGLPSSVLIPTDRRSDRAADTYLDSNNKM